MWDNIIIGTGNKGNTAIRDYRIEGKHSISKGINAFWISSCVFGLGITIFYDTPQGRKLEKLIIGKVPLNVIQKYIDGLCLKRVSADYILQNIKQIKEESFRKGQESKQEEIKSVLGIKNYY